MTQVSDRVVPCVQAARLCPVCANAVVSQMHHQDFVLPEEHPLDNGYDVVCCQACGFVYADTRVSQADYAQFYAKFSKYQDSTHSSGGGGSPRDAARLRDTARLISERIPDLHARIVDIGCANGGLLEAFSILGFQNLLGIDPSPACIARVMAKGIKTCVGTLQELPAQAKGADCMIISHVLEHVQDVSGTLEVIREAISTGGMLYVEVPDATRYADFLYAPFQDFITEHINHFSPVSLDNALQRAGFECLCSGMRTLEIGHQLFYPAIYGFFRPATGLPAPMSGRDLGLEVDIRRYIADSSRLMASIERHLASSLRDERAILMWGAGQMAMKVLRLKCLRRLQLIACIDSNPVNHGTRLGGAPVLGPTQVPVSESPIVVATLLHQTEIVEQIRRMGLKNRIVSLLDETCGAPGRPSQ